MKRIRLLFPALLVLVLLLAPQSAFAAYTYDSNPSIYDYYITAYDVNIDVDEDNVLHITENITADFKTARHGIFRTIPYNFYVDRQDGTTSHAKIKIKNIDCSEEFDVNREDGTCVIKLGDADKTVTGEHSYTIMYDYDIGMDLLKNGDEFYYNIIGDEWDTYISNVTFTVNMPKEFDSSKLGFSTGYYGSTGSDIADYQVNGNVISGAVTQRLSPNQAATIRLELPEGYFYFDSSEQNFFIAVMAILPFLCLFAIIIIWAKFGNDKKIEEVIEFRPPENMSSLDVAYWYNGVATGNDVIPLLLELANEGYITIEENETDGYRIKKKRGYNGTDSAKTIFMSGLFAHGDVTYKKKLENTFYSYINRILEKYNTIEKRKKVFIGKSLTLRIVCWFLTAALCALSAFVHSQAYSTDISDIVFLASIAVYAVSFILSFFVRKRTNEGHEILQKINGFKKFLETAEKERLEALVEESPEYFYDILPYAYVLDVSKKWIKKFESIAIQPPEWYASGRTFDRYMMWHFINTTMSDCKSTMQSSPQSSSSVGSSGGGGGFAGGGFGGGGGGSW